MAAVKVQFSGISTIENGEYYFKTINEVLNTCTNIDEFDIIPCVKSEESNFPFVLDEKKLGIFSWCVKELFFYAYGELMKLRKPGQEFEGPRLLALSQLVLLLHPEDYTIWNLRKCYLKRLEISSKTELDFCLLVLKKHPRSAETFSHRRWLINLLRVKEEHVLETKQFLQNEMHLTLLCAERYHDNYITWDQRCWLVDNFMFDKMEWLEEELNSITDWLWTHVSDNCVYHFRQHLLKQMASSCSLIEIKEKLLEEFKLTDEILKHYPVFETVWYHRRFLVSFWSTKFSPCRTCLKLWQNQYNEIYYFKDLKKDNKIKYYVCCQECKTVEENDRVSIGQEMEFCGHFIVQKECPELVRQSHLAFSYLQWLWLFCKKLLERT